MLPNIKDETHKKLSTPEGIKNRQSIIDSLSEEELSQTVIRDKPSYFIEKKNIKTNINDLLTPSTNFIDKAITLKSWRDLTSEEISLLEKETINLKTDILIDKLKNIPDYRNHNYIVDLINNNIENEVKKILLKYPDWGKIQVANKLVNDNPLYKDEILSVISNTIDKQIEHWKEKLPEETFNKAMKIVEKEDMNEIELVSKNRSIRNIKSLKSINKSHSNLLESIKKQAKNESHNIGESIDKIDSESNLFD